MQVVFHFCLELFHPLISLDGPLLVLVHYLFELQLVLLALLNQALTLLLDLIVAVHKLPVRIPSLLPVKWLAVRLRSLLLERVIMQRELNLCAARKREGFYFALKHAAYINSTELFCLLIVFQRDSILIFAREIIAAGGGHFVLLSPSQLVHLLIQDMRPLQLALD